MIDDGDEGFNDEEDTRMIPMSSKNHRKGSYSGGSSSRGKCFRLSVGQYTGTPVYNDTITAYKTLTCLYYSILSA